MKKQWLSLLCMILCIFAFSSGLSAATLLDTGLSGDTDKVHVIIENTTFDEEFAEENDLTWEDSFWTGTLVDTWVELNDDSTMMSCVKAALESEGLTAEGLDSGYISSINGLSAFDGGGYSGWMGTLNDWFTNEGFSAYTVADGTLADGDEICVCYSITMGEDLGGSWNNNSTALKALESSEGTLSPEFDGDVNEYSLKLPEGTDSVKITPTAENKNFQVRIYVGDKEYKRTEEIPVDKGLVITVKCGDTSWPSMNTSSGATEYTIEVEMDRVVYDSDWSSFRNNSINNGITAAQTPRTVEETEVLWEKTFSTDWSDTPSPLILVDDSVVSICGNSVKKINKVTGEVTAVGALSASYSWGTVPATYSDGLIFCPLGGGTVEALSAKTLNSVWIYKDENGGGAYSPVTYDDGKIYTGFGGYNKEDAFVCLDAETGKLIWRATDARGFYWAGAAIVGDYVVYGSDSGHLYSRDKETGKLVTDLEVGEATTIRSSVCYDNGKVYFAINNGKLGMAAINGETGELSDLEIIDCSAYGTGATSTPVIYKGMAYMGVGKGGDGHYIGIDLSTKEIKWSVNGSGHAQTSPLLSTAYEEDGYLYLYVAYNNNPGGVEVIKAKADGSEAVQTTLYDAARFEQWCTASVICDEDGTIYHKNDSGAIFAIAMKDEVKQQLAADAVDKKIAAIGEVTLDSKDTIEGARAAYDALSDEAKALVTKADTLTAAEAKLAQLEKEAADKAAAKAVDEKIAAIGEVTLDSKDAIDAARAAYNALTADQKALVSKADDLVAAEEAYAYITAEIPFTDLAKDGWYQDSVRYVYVNGIMNGMTGTTFEPDSELTRAMYITMLYRLGGKPEVKATSSYDDVKDDEWYSKAVAWGTEKGIVEGYNGKFSPMDSITREQMAAMMYRYAKLNGCDVSNTASFDAFKDGNTVSDWAKEEMGWAVASKLMQGHDNGTLEPKGSATRAQAAAVIQRFAEMTTK
ncbi:MAG: S-layer homology domain-containing protein [Clostridia bacterium]